MIKPKLTTNEEQRLQSLDQYAILDTEEEAAYDKITELASKICGTPISLISLVDQKRQWFKSHHGLDARHTDREVAFCAHAIHEPNKLFVIEDSRKDERFHDNPLVTDDPNVIFYAGAPLVEESGHALGTLCVIDHQPKQLDEQQKSALKSLSEHVVQLMSLRKQNRELKTANIELEKKNEGLQQFAYTAAHDIKSPLGNIIYLSKMIATDERVDLDEAREVSQLMNSSAMKLNNLIEGILRYSKNTAVSGEPLENMNILKLFQKGMSLLDKNSNPDIDISAEVDENLHVATQRIALERILVNLVTNAIKYNDKPIKKIVLGAYQSGSDICITVKDNGLGIPENIRKTMFNLFETQKNAAVKGAKGTGIGLATVKALVEQLKGKIEVESEVGKGSLFTLTIPQ
jgi:signal transduction histidine kinase